MYLPANITTSAPFTSAPTAVTSLDQTTVVEYPGLFNTPTAPYNVTKSYEDLDVDALDVKDHWTIREKLDNALGYDHDDFLLALAESNPLPANLKELKEKEGAVNAFAIAREAFDEWFLSLLNTLEANAKAAVAANSQYCLSIRSPRSTSTPSSYQFPVEIGFMCPLVKMNFLSISFLRHLAQNAMADPVTAPTGVSTEVIQQLLGGNLADVLSTKKAILHPRFGAIYEPFTLPSTLSVNGIGEVFDGSNTRVSVLVPDSGHFPFSIDVLKDQGYDYTVGVVAYFDTKLVEERISPKQFPRLFKHMKDYSQEFVLAINSQTLEATIFSSDQDAKKVIPRIQALDAGHVSAREVLKSPASALIATTFKGYNYFPIEKQYEGVTFDDNDELLEIEKRMVEQQQLMELGFNKVTLLKSIPESINNLIPERVKEKLPEIPRHLKDFFFACEQTNNRESGRMIEAQRSFAGFDFLQNRCKSKYTLNLEAENHKLGLTEKEVNAKGEI